MTRFVELAKQAEKELPFLSMEKLLQQVNREVFEMSRREDEYAGMGTTFVAATVVDHVVYVMNVGDSRLYYYDGALKQVTMDHSLVEELVRAGVTGPGGKPQSSAEEHYYQGSRCGR